MKTDGSGNLSNFGDQQAVEAKVLQGKTIATEVSTNSSSTLLLPQI